MHAARALGWTIRVQAPAVECRCTDLNPDVFKFTRGFPRDTHDGLHVSCYTQKAKNAEEHVYHIPRNTL